MARAVRRRGAGRFLETALRAWKDAGLERSVGLGVAFAGLTLLAALVSYRASDPSLNTDAPGLPTNWLGAIGANAADLAMQALGLAAWAMAALMVFAGTSRLLDHRPSKLGPAGFALRVLACAIGIATLAGVFAAPAPPAAWPLASGLGGVAGDSLLMWGRSCKRV